MIDLWLLNAIEKKERIIRSSLSLYIYSGGWIWYSAETLAVFYIVNDYKSFHLLPIIAVGYKSESF